MRLLPVTDEARAAFIAQHPYFRELEAELKAPLVDALTLRRYAPGETLFWEDEPSAGLFTLIRGQVKLYRLSPQGRQVVIRLVHPVQTFNEVSVFDQGPNPVNVTAVTESDVWHLPTETFQWALTRSPILMQAVIRTLCRRTRHLVQMVEELSLYRVTCRLARLIARLSPEELHGRHRLTQDEMAARLGTVREVITRALQELQHTGAVRVQRGRIFVTDPELLREIAMLSSKGAEH